MKFIIKRKITSKIEDNQMISLLLGADFLAMIEEDICAQIIKTIKAIAHKIILDTQGSSHILESISIICAMYTPKDHR